METWPVSTPIQGSLGVLFLLRLSLKRVSEEQMFGGEEDKKTINTHPGPTPPVDRVQVC